MSEHQFQGMSYEEILSREDALFIIYARKDDELLARALQEPGMKGNIDKSYFGHTLLAYAAMDGRAETAALLLKSGADPKVKNAPDLGTALHYAVRSQNWNVMRVLASDPRFLETASYKDSFGCIPEDYALTSTSSILAYAGVFTSLYSFEDYVSVRRGHEE